MRKRNENANPREFPPPPHPAKNNKTTATTLFICGLLAASISVFHVFQLMWSSMLTQVASKFIKFSRSTRTQYKRNSHISTFHRLDNGWNVCSAAKQISRNDFRNTYYSSPFFYYENGKKWKWKTFLEFLREKTHHQQGPPPPRGVVQRKRVMVDYVIN